VRELLCDSGSVFLQISEENIQRLRLLLDEVLGPSNFVTQIAFTKASGFQTPAIAPPRMQGSHP